MDISWVDGGQGPLKRSVPTAGEHHLPGLPAGGCTAAKVLHTDSAYSFDGSLVRRLLPAPHKVWALGGQRLPQSQESHLIGRKTHGVWSHISKMILPSFFFFIVLKFYWEIPFVLYNINFMALPSF